MDTSSSRYRLCYLMLESLNAAAGDVAQMVERSLCMREARGSIPRISISSCVIFISALLLVE